MANTTIIHKVGSGKPSPNQLKQGEIGIDPFKKVIWTYSEDESDFVELSGGDVNWNQIDPDTFPDEITNILFPDGNPDYVDLQTLKAQVAANTQAIGDLENVVGDVTSGLVKQVNDLEGRVSANETDISTNAGNIATNTGEIQSNALAIGALDGRVTVNEGDIETNKDEITRLEGLINNSLTGLVLGGEYDANQNKVVSTTAEGIAAGLAVDSALPGPSESTKGIYVIVTVGGPLSGTGTRSPNREEDGTMAHKGDWLVSDGIHGWILFELGQQDVTFGMIGGSPDDNAALKAALDSKIAVGDTIDCGQYT
jgi:hypothetical protein